MHLLLALLLSNQLPGPSDSLFAWGVIPKSLNRCEAPQDCVAVWERCRGWEAVARSSTADYQTWAKAYRKSLFKRSPKAVCPARRPTTALLDCKRQCVLRPNPEWSKCEVDSDCKVVRSGCHWGATAKKHLKDGYKMWQPGDAMRGQPRCEQSRKPKAKCVEARCVAVERTKPKIAP
jgi:hypothetical protein